MYEFCSRIMCHGCVDNDLDSALRASFIMCYVDLLLSNLEDVYEIQVLC